MPKVKKIPQRQCVGCREMKDKKALLRVVKAPDGTVSLDFGGKKPGRGAYVCHDLACLQKARKTRALGPRHRHPAGLRRHGAELRVRMDRQHSVPVSLQPAGAG
ncbi:MAG: RNase P modulator RnpM [Dysosmobacter welbionis]